jgi:phosphoribosylaminoimidazolecarboxamide formyltransferase/IMP cyclohydrolase
MADRVRIERALISVSDKTDLVPFAKTLAKFGVQIISTGGTARQLAEADIDVTPIDEVTGFPEMMDGRVKTLHPRVHGGLLGLRDNDDHVAAMQEHGIEPIDLVCVNLYPFEQTIAREGVAEPEAIEQIDIGGPSMLRSASKNFRFVTVVTDPNQYDKVIAEMEAHGGSTSFALRRNLATAAFARTAAYDTAIAAWMAGQSDTALPNTLVLRMDKHPVELRYGENPHQDGAVYADPASTETSLLKAKTLHGKALSFNNYYDANGALELVKEIDPTKAAAVSVIKHANPCGFATDADVAVAFEKAYAGDPLAAFGGIVAFNQTVNKAAAEKIVEGQKFLEVILAPGYDDDALALIQERWKNVRVLALGDLPTPGDRDPRELDIKRITGGLIIQDRDLAAFDASSWDHVAGPTPDEAMLNDANLSMIIVKHLKSNAVCAVRDGMLVGAGAGQMDRVASCKLTVEKAGERALGAVVGSDAFFPFRDGPDVLIDAGVKAICQPGGSKRDDETIQACNDANVTLLFTGRRHFRH